MAEYELYTPFSEVEARKLRAGDRVYLTGIVYTARDAAHKRMHDALQRGEPLPIDLRDQVLYYVGPTPAKPGQPIGSAGPTTSYRMDAYTPALLEEGLRATIGKGPRSPEVRKAMVQHGAVYFAAVGGAAALIARSIKKAEVLAYEDLGTEAIRRLEVERLPVLVINDTLGNDLYEEGVARFRSPGRPNG